MKYKFIFIFILIISIYNHISAAQLDDEGMPIVYLRGDFYSPSWQPNPDYQFQREGMRYFINLSNEKPLPPNCKFKIGDSDWEIIDYGAPRGNNNINDTGIYSMIRGGENCTTKGIYEGTLSFTYSEGSTLQVNFQIESATLPLEAQISQTLPVIYINVYNDKTHSSLNNEIIDYNLDHKNYFEEAEYWIEIPDGINNSDDNFTAIGSASEPLPLQIKARGNWTRKGFSKKPFKVKLDKKQNLLGLTPEKSKHYALLAHADDNKGFLRNFISFNLGKRIGLPWTPSQYPVELVINGDYRGIYFLTESVRVGDGRIDIEELADLEEDPALISGGYVVELDNYEETNQIRMWENSFVSNQYLDELRVTWDTPEEYSEIQKKFVTDQFSAMNNMIGENNNDIWSYIDLDDAVRYYLVNEIISHTESYHGSTYLFRDRGEGMKWHFSPLWDAGNAFSGYTDSFFYNCDPYGNTWIPSIRENSLFNEKLKETWLWFMSNGYEGLNDDIDSYVNLISTAARYDNQRWGNEYVPRGGQPVANNVDMQSRKDNVKEHLTAKIEWLKKQFGDFSNNIYPEPERDSTPAAALPDYALAANPDNPELPDDDENDDADISTTIGELVNDKDIIYYNLQGIRIKNPVAGELYIIRQNGKTYKKVFKN